MFILSVLKMKTRKFFFFKSAKDFICRIIVHKTYFSYLKLNKTWKKKTGFLHLYKTYRFSKGIEESTTWKSKSSLERCRNHLKRKLNPSWIDYNRQQKVSVLEFYVRVHDCQIIIVFKKLEISKFAIICLLLHLLRYCEVFT